MNKANDPTRNYIIAHYGRNSPYLRIYDIQHGYTKEKTPVGHGLNNKPPKGPIAGSPRAKGQPDPMVGHANTAGRSTVSGGPKATPTKTIADRNTSGAGTKPGGTTTKTKPTTVKPTPTPVYNLPTGKVGTPLPKGWGQNVGTPVPMSMAGVGTPFDMSLAHKYASMEFDPQIAALQKQVDFLPKQTAQNLFDIRNWYGQVMGSLDTARQQALQQGNAQTASLGAATQGIMQSLGGGATGDTIVGNAGASAAALANQLGGIESNFLSQEGPLLQAEGAAQATREQARQQGIARDLAQQMLGLQGQRGGKEADYATQFQQYNNQLTGQKNENAFNIQQYNNQLLNQRQQNALSVLQYNNQLAQQNRANLIDTYTTAAALGLTGAQTKLIGAQADATAASAPGKFVPWDKLNPNQQNYQLDRALAQVAPSKGLHGWTYVDPNDTSSSAQKTRVANQRIINQARKSMRSFFMTQHYANPRLYQRIDQLINQAVKQAAILSKANQPY